MIDLTSGIIVFEVCFINYDENFESLDTQDSEYVVVNQGNDLTIDDIIKAAAGDWQPTNIKVEIYEARCGGLLFDKSGKFCDHDGDIDTATGLNGSPVYTLFYDKNGEEFDPEDITELAEEAATYYSEITEGVDEDELEISPEADALLTKGLEAGLAQHFTSEELLEVTGYVTVE